MSALSPLAGGSRCQNRSTASEVERVRVAETAAGREFLGARGRAKQAADSLPPGQRNLPNMNNKISITDNGRPRPLAFSFCVLAMAASF